MKTIVLSKNNSKDISKISWEKVQAFKVSFDLDGASFSREDTSLSIKFEDGEELLLEDFFVLSEEVEDLPSFILEDGTLVDGSSFLESMNPDLDLSTAAGPAASTAAGSGSGDYSDVAGDLIGGLDRLGDQDSDFWSRADFEDSSLASVNIALAGISEGLGLTGGGGSEDSGGGGDTGGGGEDPKPPLTDDFIPYSLRGIIFTKGADTNEQHLDMDLSSMGWEVTDFILMDINGNPISDGPASAYIHEGKLMVNLEEPDLGASQDIYCKIQVKNSDGTYEEKMVQVHLNDSNYFNSSSKDSADGSALDGGGLIHGEWYSGPDSSSGGSYYIKSSELDDELIFSDSATGNFNTGAGADAIIVYGNLSGTINAGAGKDIVTIKGDLSGTIYGDSNGNMNGLVSDSDIINIGAMSGESII